MKLYNKRQHICNFTPLTPDMIDIQLLLEADKYIVP